MRFHPISIAHSMTIRPHSRFSGTRTAAKALRVASLSIALVAVVAGHGLAQQACSRPISSGAKPVASDCLLILRVAVGLQTCTPACICAPTGTLPTKASDALICLASATGRAVTLDCPCEPSCTPAQCEAIVDACESDVDAAKVASDAACPSAPGEARTACLARATKAEEAGDRVCITFSSTCEGCCESGAEDCTLAPDVPRVTGEYEAADRRYLEETTQLPPGPGGTDFMLLQLPDGAIGFDPFTRTPATAAAECAAAVIACFSPGERNWAGCLAVAPTCTNETPWLDSGPGCCTTACLDRYQRLLREGRSNPAAFTAAIYESPSCMPGLDVFTGRAQ